MFIGRNGAVVAQLLPESFGYKARKSCQLWTSYCFLSKTLPEMSTHCI